MKTKLIKSRRTWVQDGEERSYWYNVGEVVYIKDKMYIRLNTNPEILYYVFDRDNRDEGNS
jgi:hypothetical protein